MDNKELLAICDQLNIAVKSHSSTISESEAERIRTAAEKLVATNVVPKKELGTTSHKPNSPQSGSHNRPAQSHKQQILEIRKPKILRNPTSNAPEASAATNNQVASSEVNSPSPPRPFATPVSPMKPTAPTRPVPRNQSETIPEPAIAEAEQTLDTQEPENMPETVAAEKPEKTAQQRPKADKPQKPQLVSPPARPSGEKSSVIDQSSQAEKPILKRERPRRVEEEREPQTRTPTACRRRA